MNNILIGNEVNIQFDNVNYTTKNIILRLLMELDNLNFPCDYITDNPLFLKGYIGKLFLVAREIIDGEFDKFVSCSIEERALNDFKERYRDKKKSLRIADIGFEDYYLIHDLFCHKLGIVNPEQYVIKEALKMTYFYSIYNHGNLNLLYKKYSNHFKKYLMTFDNIFTTNYDSNLESVTRKEIYHLHGQFDKLSEVYNPKSFRNSLKDTPLNGVPNDPCYTYLHSTALSTYCGDYKRYQIKQNTIADELLETITKNYTTTKSLRKDVDSWKNVDNELLINLAQAIKIKFANPQIRFQEDYSISRFSNITGKLTILGLSPYNDYHLFEIINKSNINQCTYYYFNKLECNKIEMLLSKIKKENRLLFKKVKEFWRACNEKKKIC